MAYKNIAVQEEIHALAKVKAAQEGVPLGRLVTYLLEDWLNEDDTEKGEEENGGTERHQRVVGDD